jgi:exodeoxyribonuclease V
LLKEEKGLKIAFCSYTGKATRVLNRKLVESKSVRSGDFVGTIHRLIYQAIVDDDDNVIGWEKQPLEDFKYGLIIVDEASMVTEEIWQDLLSFEVPILAVGDHGQLPPINSNFNLMAKPELKLEEIYRQEANNPIIKVSEIARKYGHIPTEEFSRTVKKLSKTESETQEVLGDIFSSFNDDTMVLCGYNKTRINLNKAIRSLHFETPNPQPGDRVICLKNNRIMDIFNGMTGTILDISREGVKDLSFYEAEIALDYEEIPFYGKISLEQFNSPELIDKKMEELHYFDFGYALTVHKAQGSQAKRVVVFEERFPKMDDDTFRRWLYTAVTRAEEELYIVG